MTEPESKKDLVVLRGFVMSARRVSLPPIWIGIPASTTAYNGKQVCVVLDYASRMILSGGEFSRATTNRIVHPTASGCI